MQRIFQFCIASFILCLLSFNAAYALTVQDIRYGTYPEKTRIVLELDQPVDFRAFTLNDPHRIVLDLPGFQWRAGTTADNSAITTIRHGNLNQNISRIVWDLKSYHAIDNAFLLPATGQAASRLVIDIKPALGPGQNDQTVFGTLDPNTYLENKGLQSAAAPPAIATPQSKPIPRSAIVKPLIILDPGHGGIDPGALGPNKVHEKTVVLALAKELRKQLEGNGQYRVKMTRETDIFIKLSDRVKFARRHGGDLFVSIHADSIGKPSVNGASVYTLSEKASDAQTARLAARENRADLIAGIDLNTEDEEVASILMDLAMRDTMNQSKYFANTIVHTLGGGGVKLLERPHRYAGFAVLKAPDIPSILIEAGFMSNRKEAAMLSDPSYRKKVARSLKRGIDTYFETLSENSQ